MSFRMVRKRRPGDRSVIRTPREIVRCEFDGPLIVANCNGSNARRILQKKGFRLEEAPQAKAKAKPKPKPKAKRARDEDGHFKGDDPTTPTVNEAWSPPKKVAKKPTKKK